MNFFTDALSKRNSVHKQSHLQVHRERQRYLFYLDMRKGLTLLNREPHPEGSYRVPAATPGVLPPLTQVSVLQGAARPNYTPAAATLKGPARSGFWVWRLPPCPLSCPAPGTPHRRREAP